MFEKISNILSQLGDSKSILRNMNLKEEDLYSTTYGFLNKVIKDVNLEKMNKSTTLFNEVCSFIDKYNISNAEYIYQRETIYDNCVDLVASLVETILED